MNSRDLVCTVCGGSIAGKDTQQGVVFFCKTCNARWNVHFEYIGYELPQQTLPEL